MRAVNKERKTNEVGTALTKENIFGDCNREKHPKCQHSTTDRQVRFKI